ncbi:MAG: endonuclease VIII [Deltaproteobacteria bacterium]|nr:endonuclease VIII [Deltaproteobacteria bacterium]
MPERPDLEYVVPRLADALAGAVITATRVRKPVVLRLAVEGKPEELWTGRRFGAVSRRAHFVLFALAGGAPDVEMVVAPMLAGRFTVDDAGERSPGDLAVAWTLSDGRELRYRDSEQMGKVYLLPRGRWDQVPGLQHVGVDVLDAQRFTREAFRTLARTRRDQVRVFIMDKSALDSLGNAYADEVLWHARIHPKTMARALSDDELDALHGSIVHVLSDARDEVARRQAPLDEKVRDFLKVRNRHGEPCPRCGTTLRCAGVHGHDTFFCPQCQPETRRSSIVDWRKAPSTPGPAAPPGVRQKRSRR